MRGNTFRLAAGIALAVIFGAFIISKLDWQLVWGTLVKARLEYLFLGLICLGFSYLVRIARWWCLLKVQAPNISFNACVWPYLLGALCSILIPLRAGDLIRAFGFREQLQSPGTRILGTLVLERAVDLVAIVLLFLTLSTSISSAEELPPNIAIIAVTIAGLILVGILVLWVARGSIRRATIWLARHPWLERKDPSHRISSWVDHFFDGISALQRPGLLLQVLGLTALLWLSEGCVFVMAAWSLGIESHPLAPWFAFALATLSTAIPSTPGHVGTFHYFAALGMVAYGLDWSRAAAFAVVGHLLLLTPFALILITYLVSKRRLPSFRIRGDTSEPGIASKSDGPCS